MRAFSLALILFFLTLLFLFGCVGNEGEGRENVQELIVYEGVGIPINEGIEAKGKNRIVYGGAEIKVDLVGKGNEVNFDGNLYKGTIYDRPGGNKVGDAEVVIAKLTLSKSKEEGIEILRVNKSSIFWTLLLIPAKKEVSLEEVTAYVKAGGKLYRAFKLNLRGSECLKNVKEVEGKEEIYCLFVVPEKSEAIVVSPYGIKPTAYVLLEKPI